MYLGKIESIIQDYNEDGVIITGDLNADVNKVFYHEITQLCDTLNLVISDVCLLPHDTYTHVNNASLTRSWLDHYITSQAIHDSIIHLSVDNTYHGSDHFPVHLKFRLNILPRLLKDNTDTVSTINWHFENVQKRNAFYELVMENLRNVTL